MTTAASLTAFEQETLDLWREGIARLTRRYPDLFPPHCYIGFWHIFDRSRRNIPRQSALRRLALKGHLEYEDAESGVLCFRLPAQAGVE